jgi:hypothetical protein
MVYSNEVILCNTRYARYVDINDCSDIDLQDLDLYNRSSGVHKQDYQTLSSRISKIGVEVYLLQFLNVKKMKRMFGLTTISI